MNTHEKLAAHLAEREITDKAFAERIGVSKWRMSKIRNGRARPNLDEAAAIEKATGGKIKASAWAR